jgi:hypothetical protein
MLNKNNLILQNQNLVGNNDPRINNTINILSRDSGILLKSIEEEELDCDYSKAKIILKGGISNQNSMFNNSNNGYGSEFKELDGLILDHGFAEKMYSDAEFFKFIYFHPLLKHHEQYKDLKSKFRKHFINLVSSQMKDNQTFKPPTYEDPSLPDMSPSSAIIMGQDDEFEELDDDDIEDDEYIGDEEDDYFDEDDII